MSSLCSNTLVCRKNREMSDYFTLGSTPCAEPCAQVGRDNYHDQSRIESRVYLHQLQRVVAEIAGISMDSDDFITKYETFTLRVKSFPHDFGSYKEVSVIFDDEASAKLACMLEDSLPENWDAEALKELAELNYTLHLELS